MGLILRFLDSIRIRRRFSPVSHLWLGKNLCLFTLCRITPVVLATSFTLILGLHRRSITSTSSLKFSLPSTTVAKSSSSTSRTAKSTASSSSTTSHSSTTSSSFKSPSFPFSSFLVWGIGVSLRSLSPTETTSKTTTSPFSRRIFTTISSFAGTIGHTSIFLVFSLDIIFSTATSSAFASFFPFGLLVDNVCLVCGRLRIFSGLLYSLLILFLRLVFLRRLLFLLLLLQEFLWIFFVQI
mmetsp:Transcript_23835/g.39033  ORF Transcript_23835/g.39033 Transcript_23835/m.39033 type:complete len:239 (+) Transcript_23835:2054-2770(+)